MAGEKEGEGQKEREKEAERERQKADPRAIDSITYPYKFPLPFLGERERTDRQWRQ